MADRFYIIEYVDGSKEDLDLSKFGCYDINLGVYDFSGTGGNAEKLVLYMGLKKPIVLMKEIGKDTIEKIINTEQIKSITLNNKE